MSGRYEVGGRSAATAATAGHAAAQIWNPHATKRIKVVEFAVCITAAAVANIAVRRSTARGTPGSTVTPDSDNAIERDLAPPSGFLLDLAAFSAQPTIDANELRRWNLPGSIGAGMVLPVEWVIPPGTGIVIVTPTAVILPASDFTFVVDD